MSRRIGFSQTDAEHIYEWLLMYWHGDDQPFGGCFQCENLGRRLKNFIGPVEARRVARVVKKYPTKSAKGS